MATTLRREGCCWQNRFVTPGAQELADAVARSLRPTLACVRKRLLSVDGVCEQVQWQGVWKWTLVYTHRGQPGRAWAFLVPDPERPRLCIPMPEVSLGTPKARRLTRELREMLSQAPVVNGARWPVWTLQNKAQAEELLSLCELKAPATDMGEVEGSWPAPMRG